jgi:3-deoxy-D-manno-octulosonic-acid transferase
MLRPLLRPALERVDLLAAQTDAFAERFREFGAPAQRTIVAGSLKFDVAALAPPSPSVQHFYRAFCADRRVIVAGSTHLGEEKLLADALLGLRAELPQLALIVAPRHLKRADEAAADLQRAGLSVVRRSASVVKAADALLVDVVGELGWVYRLGAAAFVGGSFSDAGGHNVLEPAAVGTPVVVGPKTPNFRLEVDTLRAAGGLVVARDAAELRAALAAWLRDEPARERAAAAAGDAVAAHRGATDRVAAMVAELTEG